MGTPSRSWGSNSSFAAVSFAASFISGYSLALITLTDVTCYRHLTDVPRGTPGLVPGSSGSNFVELVIRGGSAAHHFGLQSGDVPLRKATEEYAA